MGALQPHGLPLSYCAVTSSFSVLVKIPDSKDPLAGYLQSMKAVLAAPWSAKRWSSVSVSDRQSPPFRPYTEMQHELTIEQAEEVVRTAGARSTYISAETAIAVPTHSGGLRNVFIEVTLRQHRTTYSSSAQKLLPTNEAQIKIDFLKVEHFFTSDVIPTRQEGDRSSLSLVQRNTSSLLEFIEELIAKTQPEWVAVYDDAGIPILPNSRLLWFSDTALLTQEILAFYEIWKSGHPGYPKDPPMSNWRDEIHAFYLHEQRTAEDRVRYNNQLREAFTTFSSLEGGCFHLEGLSLRNLQGWQSLCNGIVAFVDPLFGSLFLDSEILQAIKQLSCISAAQQRN